MAVDSRKHEPITLRLTEYSWGFSFMNALRRAIAGLLMLGAGSQALAQQAWNAPMGQPVGGWAQPGMAVPYGMPPGMAPPYAAAMPPGARLSAAICHAGRLLSWLRWAAEQS